MKPKKPYSQRDDTEKLKSNWTKTLGLFQRHEFSMAIVRAATCAEIAANIAIRSELIDKRGLDPEFVDSLMIWANGLRGKFDRLLMPVTKGTHIHAVLKRHQKEAFALNDTRNGIAHQGRFVVYETAEKSLALAHSLCIGIAKAYGHDLALKDPTEPA